jgi:hypothetical protein
LQAFVVSLTSNMLCANLDASELKLLIYINWPNARLLEVEGGAIRQYKLPGQKILEADYEKGYNITISGYSMASNCEDASNKMSYKSSQLSSTAIIVRNYDY